MKRAGFLIMTTAAIALAVTFAMRANRALRNLSAPTTATNQASTAALPDFTVRDLEGHDVTLSQFRGKVVLLNFWATWCGPCNIEIPWLMEFHQKYNARGFTVLGVAMDEEGKTAVTPFVQTKRFRLGDARQPMNYPIVLGNDEIADKFGGLLGFPTSILISKSGHVVQRVDGLVSYDEIDKTIQAELGSN